MPAMPVFYTKRFIGGDAMLDEEESRHIIRVLRLTAGDPLEMVDGMGNLYSGIILDPDPAGTRVRILETTRDHLARNYHLHLAIAPTKSTDRFEWFLEKATEIGVDEITPILCERSERSHIRQERSEKIILAAMKQSGRALLPALYPMVPLPVFLDSAKADLKYIAHCGTDPAKHLARIAGVGPATEKPAAAKPVAAKPAAAKPESAKTESAKTESAKTESAKRSWLVMIGPEGDFTRGEVDVALQRDFEEISLGEAVFRTETAGIIACQLVNFLSGP
jgi:16S rRNA (uracil1498-N3)-methyltransferase